MIRGLNRLRALKDIPFHTNPSVTNGVYTSIQVRNFYRTTSLLQKESSIQRKVTTPQCNITTKKLETLLIERDWEKSWSEFSKLLKTHQGDKLSIWQLTRLLQVITKKTSAESEKRGEKVINTMKEYQIHCNSGREYSSLILFFGKYGRFGELKQVLTEMKERGIQKDVFVFNALIESFGRISSSQAYGVYQLLQQESVTPNSYTFDILAKAAESHEDTELLRKIYEDIKKYTTNLDVSLYTTMMNVCLIKRDLELGMKLYKDMVQHRQAFDPFVNATFLDMLLKQGEAEKSVDVYENMIQHKMPVNSQMMNTMLSVFSENKLHSKAIDVFSTMIVQKLTPSQEKCDHFLQEVCKSGNIQQAVNVYGMMHSVNIIPSENTCQLLLSKYLADSSEAQWNLRICQQMVEQGIRLNEQDVETMIERYLKTSRPSYAIDLYDSIAAQGIQLSRETQQAVSDARKVHEIEKNRRTTEHYRFLIINSSKKRDFKQGVRLFEEMLSTNIKPDQFVYTMAMNCYSHCGNGEKVIELWNIVKDLPLPQKARNISASILLDSCGLNSTFDTLRATWEGLKTSKFPLDENNFTSYIEALCKHGKYPEARRVFQIEMEESGLQQSFKTCETIITQFKMSKHRHEFHKLFSYIQAKHPKYFSV
ncbi:hypothetical protein K7432_000279 [Basidiobolus ranarum]|uniref:PROP1-like PPR domain-containing protein n=1 Tax=Basidiobolus ranarum TaxID=34480 RepID=A0ABR2WBF8_9FUNG